MNTGVTLLILIKIDKSWYYILIANWNNGFIIQYLNKNDKSEKLTKIKIFFFIQKYL